MSALAALRAGHPPEPFDPDGAPLPTLELRLEQAHWPLTEQAQAGLFAVHRACHSGEPEHAYNDANMGADPRVWLAWAAERVVGFKVGGARQSGIFESRMGGVHPGFRRRGIARALMRQQHADLRSAGYTSVHTQTKNEFRPMLRLNLAEGFRIFGCAFPGKEPLLLLHKSLSESADPAPPHGSAPVECVVFQLAPLPLSDEHRADIERLHLQGFGEKGDWVYRWLEGRPRAACWLALHNDRVVGFKFGAEQRPGAHHSHEGVVDARYRGQGIAKELMRRQHAWAAEQGCTVVTTNTLNDNIAMLQLNLASGFDVVGVEAARGRAKLQLRKSLTGPGFGPEAHTER